MDKFTKNICDSIFEKNSVEDFKNKTILITGANGLIGGFLSDYFNYLNTKKDYNIKLLLTSKSDKLSAYRLYHIIDNPNVTYDSIDLSVDKGPQTLKSILDNKIDFCFYCAGYAQPLKFMSDSYSTLAINIIGLHNILTSVYKNNNLAKVIYLSSSEIYTNNNTLDSHKEDDDVNFVFNNKRNCYILGKLSGENIIKEFHNKGYNAKSARVSLCYGPGVSLDDTRVMSELVNKAIEKDNIKLFDDGSAYRCYLHISDCCAMLLNIVNGKESVYNIGGKEETTIYDMAKIIGNKFNKNIIKGKIQNKISSSAPKKVWVSLNRYENEFGPLNLKPFKEGLVEFIDWYKLEKQMANIDPYLQTR